MKYSLQYFFLCFAFLTGCIETRNSEYYAQKVANQPQHTEHPQDPSEIISTMPARVYIQNSTKQAK